MVRTIRKQQTAIYQTFTHQKFWWEIHSCQTFTLYGISWLEKETKSSNVSKIKQTLKSKTVLQSFAMHS